MSDDWYEKYMRDRANRDKQRFQQSNNPADLPHYQPAHTDLDMEKMLAGVPGNPMRPDSPDPMAILQQRLMTGQLQSQQSQQHHIHQPRHTEVRLIEGSNFYKMVHKADGEYTISVVRKIGQLRNVQNKSFTLRTEEKCYILKESEVLDLGRIRPEELRNLVSVEAPFDGVILVPRSAIVEQGHFPGNKGLLKG